MEKKLVHLFSNLSDEEIIELSKIDFECKIDNLTTERIKTASFRKVGLSDEGLKTENKKKRFISWRKVFILAACLIIIITILSTTGFSQYIPQLWTSKVNLGDGSEVITLNKEVGLIHIKEDAPKKDLRGISLKTAEEIIGVDFLNSEMYTNDSLNYMPIIPSKVIEAVNLWYPSCVAYEGDVKDDNDSNDKYISGNFRLLTDKATIHVIPNEDIDATGGKELLRSYNSSNLNTKVILYTVNWSESRLTVVFDYMNVHYTFIGQNVTETEMMEFIETLK